jgi:hypothetical protein
MRTYYAAPGDLSTVWEGDICDNANPPHCDGQQNCGICIEIQCDPNGTYTYPGDSDPHGACCRTDQSVVVAVVDACPHSHPNNTYWCTEQRPHHVDISCSAFAAITQDRPISQTGNVNAMVRVVDCSVGLGPKSL